MLTGDLKAPLKSIKDQIRELHPSCAMGTLKQLSKDGIACVESMLGCFCKVNFRLSWLVCV